MQFSTNMTSFIKHFFFVDFLIDSVHKILRNQLQLTTFEHFYCETIRNINYLR